MTFGYECGFGITTEPMITVVNYRIRKDKPIGIGVENYKEMIDQSYYYVDKTLTIRV